MQTTNQLWQIRGEGGDERLRMLFRMVLNFAETGIKKGPAKLESLQHVFLVDRLTIVATSVLRLLLLTAAFEMATFSHLLVPKRELVYIEREKIQWRAACMSVTPGTQDARARQTDRITRAYAHTHAHAHTHTHTHTRMRAPIIGL